MSNFRQLFQFTTQEANWLFKVKKTVSKLDGLTIMSTISLFSDETKLGKVLIVTSRKVGSACERNLLRRRIKYLFYTNKFYNLPVCTAIICYKKAVALSFTDLQNLILEHLQKKMLHHFPNAQLNLL